MTQRLRIGIVAGESSGDLLGAALIKALAAFFPDAEFVGVAGKNMQALGAKSLFPLDKLSVMGFSEVIVRLKELLFLRHQVKKFFLDHRPDVYIGIDSPDFNLPIEKALKKAGIKTVHYNSPTIWAWRENRIKTIAKSVDLMLTLFPFEEKFYQHSSIPVKYIGHPLADIISSETKQNNFNHNDFKNIALLPGSRSGEIKHIAPVLLKSAVLLSQKYPDSAFSVPMIDQQKAAQFTQLWKALAPELNLNLSIGNAREMMAKSDLVILASGTATLEALLLKRPMIVVYKTSRLSYWIAKKLIKIRHISLPNILSEEKLVPELLQAEASPENILAEVEHYKNHPEKIKYLQEKFSDIHAQLRCNAAQNAAAAIAQMLSQ